MNDYIPVKGYPGLVRDTRSNAIINVDFESLEKEKEKIKLKEIKDQQERELKNKVSSMEKELHEVKSLLKNILEKL